MTTDSFTIAKVADLTGIAKEVLRKWESRYGFPVPQRDAIGRRNFNIEQISRLYLIKRLLDQGMRARHVVSLPLQALGQLLEESAFILPQIHDTLSGELIAALTSAHPQALQGFFTQRLLQLGLRSFVCDLVPVMNTLVGTAWASGAIAVSNEHFYTETLKALLAVQIAGTVSMTGGPRILLATAPGEVHTLGLLTIRTVLALEDVDCMYFGACLSCEEIVIAAQQYETDIIGLSFSDAFPVKKIVEFLTHLRLQLPEHVAIWAGGSGVRRLSKGLPGTEVLPDVDSMLRVLKRVRLSTLPAPVSGLP